MHLWNSLLAIWTVKIKRLQTELISEKEYEKLLNSFETSFIANNSDVRGIAYSLAVDYTFYKDTNLINKELDLYRKVTREDIRRVAKQYLNANQRLEIDYLPEKKIQLKKHLHEKNIISKHFIAYPFSLVCPDRSRQDA